MLMLDLIIEQTNIISYVKFDIKSPASHIELHSSSGIFEKFYHSICICQEEILPAMLKNLSNGAEEAGI